MGPSLPGALLFSGGGKFTNIGPAPLGMSRCAVCSDFFVVVVVAVVVVAAATVPG